MKRSEMILKIQLERTCEIEEVESILNMIEEFGMLPPSKYHGLTYAQKKAGLPLEEDLFDNKWEPEE